MLMVISGETKYGTSRETDIYVVSAWLKGNGLRLLLKAAGVPTHGRLGAPTTLY